MPLLKVLNIHTTPSIKRLVGVFIPGFPLVTAVILFIAISSPLIQEKSAKLALVW